MLISPTVVSFTELEAGTPLVFNRRGSIGVAVSGWVQGYHLAVPAEKRSHTALRTAGLAAWVLSEPNTRIWHAVGLSGHLAPTQGGVFALVIQDTVSGGTISYRLNATGKRVLCLAPSAELVVQNREKFLATGNNASMFSASAGANM